MRTRHACTYFLSVNVLVSQPNYSSRSTWSGQFLFLINGEYRQTERLIWTVDCDMCLRTLAYYSFFNPKVNGSTFIQRFTEIFHISIILYTDPHFGTVSYSMGLSRYNDKLIGYFKSNVTHLIKQLFQLENETFFFLCAPVGVHLVVSRCWHIRCAISVIVGHSIVGCWNCIDFLIKFKIHERHKLEENNCNGLDSRDETRVTTMVVTQRRDR